MNTLMLGKEAKTFAKSKRILLTLKKTAGNCHMTAVITPINENRGLKIVDRKFVVIKKNFRDGRYLFSKENYGLDKVDVEVDGSQMTKTNQSLTEDSKSLDNEEQCSILKNPTVSELKCCQNCSEVLYRGERGDDSDTKSIGPTLNKHDRFVPNILRSTKAVENIINNNTHCEISYKIEKKNIKRNRKQVLRPLNSRHDFARRNYRQKNSKLNKSTPRIRYKKVAKKRKTETPSVTSSNLKQKDKKKKSVDMDTHKENVTHDTYSADLNILCENIIPPIAVKTEVDRTDKSIQKIFDEFEVADYQNYIASEDLNFHIDEMDKLLSSAIDGSLTEHDVDDNDVDSHGNGLKKRKNKSKRKSSDIRSQTEYYEPNVKTRRIQRYKNLDDICSGSFEHYNLYQTSKMGQGSHIFQDYSSSDDFQDLNDSLEAESSSSTDSASECENEQTSLVRSLSLLLPKTENLDCLSTSLVVNDVVPDNVFSDEFCSDGLDSGDDVVKRQVASSPMMQKADVDLTGSINDDFDCSEPLERLGDLEFFNGVDTNLGFSEDGHYLVDNNILNIECTTSSPDESCKSILADSNIEFDDEHFLNMLSVLPDLDIENVDDIEISKLLGVDNAIVNKFQHVTDPPLRPTIINPLPRLISTEFDHSTEGEMEEMIEAGCNLKSEFSHALEEENFLFNDDGDIREIGLNDDRDFELNDSLLMNVSEGDELVSERGELVSSCDPEAEYIDDTELDRRCSTPLLPERKIVEEDEMSKLKRLLTRPRTVVDNRPVISRIYSKFDCNKFNVGCSDVNITNSVKISLDENVPPRVTEYRSTKDTLTSHIAQEVYMDDRDTVTDQDTMTDSEDKVFYNRSQSINHQLLELDASHERCTYKFQLHSDPVSSKNGSSSVSSRDNWRKPEPADVTKKLVKMKKYARQNSDRYFPCPLCDQMCKSDVTLAYHIHAFHRDSPSLCNAGAKKYVCDKCSKEYSLAGAIEKHFALHENYSLTCKICKKHFSEKVYLRRHIYCSHLHLGYECSYCSGNFGNKNALTRHLKKYHGIKQN